MLNLCYDLTSQFTEKVFSEPAEGSVLFFDCLPERFMLQFSMTSLLQIDCFGMLRVQYETSILHRFYSQQAALLMASLVLDTNHCLPREVLAERLWPEISPEIGRNRLKQTLSALRRQIVSLSPLPLFSSDRFQIGLNRDCFTADVLEFERMLCSSRRDRPLQKDTLLQAIALYRGELLTGIYADWVIAERSRFANLAATAMTSLCEQLEGEHDRMGALNLAHRLIEQDPFNEIPRLSLLRLLLADGRSAEAAKQYRLYEALLRSEGMEPPAPVLQELVKPAPQRSLPLRPPAFPGSPAPTASSPKKPPVSFLPLPGTRFFGREKEIEALQHWLTQEKGKGGSRLMTLAGMGGCGKTRLSLEVGQRVFEAYRKRVWFVSLEGLKEVNSLLAAIGAALSCGAVLTEDRLLEAVIGLLEGATLPTLLILDHLEPEAGLTFGEMVLNLLARVPHLRILVTSRHPLQVQEETEIALHPLPTPCTDSLLPGDEASLLQVPSVQLLIDRLRRVKPNRVWKKEDFNLLARLSERLEGIPLSVELASSWGRTLSLQEMLERLEQPFTLLVSRAEDLPPRHRRMIFVLEETYGLLSPSVQSLFVSLSIFTGGWTLESAKRVLPHFSEPMLEGLAELQEHSFLFAEETEGQTRYRMLNTVREFALRLLTSENHQRLSRAHAHYFQQRAEEGGRELYQNRSGQWRKHLKAERPNFNAAFEWSLDQNPHIALEMGVGLLQFWVAECRYREGLSRLEPALKASGENPRVDIPDAILAAAWMSVGVLRYYEGLETAGEALEHGLELLSEKKESLEAAQCLHYLAIIAHEAGDHPKAESLYLQAKAIRLQKGDLSGTASSCQMLGRLYSHPDSCLFNREKSSRLLRQGLVLSRQTGHRSREGAVFHFMATAALWSGEGAMSEIYSKEALKIFHEEDNQIGIYAVSSNSPPCSDPDAEENRLREIARYHRTTGHPEKIVLLAGACFNLALRCGKWGEAAQILGALGLDWRENRAAQELGISLSCEELRAKITPETYRTCWTEGSLKTPVEMIQSLLFG